MRRQALRRWWRATTAIVLLYRVRSAQAALDGATEMLAAITDARDAARGGTAFSGAYGHWSLQRLEEVWPFAVAEVLHCLDLREQAGRRHSVNALYGLHAEGR